MFIYIIYESCPDTENKLHLEWSIHLALLVFFIYIVYTISCIMWSLSEWAWPDHSCAIKSKYGITTACGLESRRGSVSRLCSLGKFLQHKVWNVSLSQRYMLFKWLLCLDLSLCLNKSVCVSRLVNISWMSSLGYNQSVAEAIIVPSIHCLPFPFSGLQWLSLQRWDVSRSNMGTCLFLKRKFPALHFAPSLLAGTQQKLGLLIRTQRLKSLRWEMAEKFQHPGHSQMNLGE